ncbi:MAG: transcriptional regulator [Desulfobulbaceae bacterium]|nr:transcriptional regulator [Desulfobulbaceae bacterium]
MTSNFITTVYGSDIPGIIKSLALSTRRHGGEWLTSKVIKLDGQFAAIMNVVVSEEREVALKESLEEKFPTLHFVYAPAQIVDLALSKTINLVVDCIDRPGLTGDLSNILANLDLSVENMECKRFDMDGIGETVFSAKLTLAVAEVVVSEVIAGEIEALSEDVQVNVL